MENKLKITNGKNQKLFSLSNIILGLGVVFILLMLFAPSFKSRVIRGVMTIGLFQPKIERRHTPTPLSEGKGNQIAFINAEKDTIHLAKLKGKVVFINVWATWCGPCKAELPSIFKLGNAVANNPEIKILTVDADGKPQQSSNFLQTENIPLPVWSVLGATPDFLSSTAIPFTIVLDKKGYIAYQHTGVADYNNATFIQFLEKLSEE